MTDDLPVTYAVTDLEHPVPELLKDLRTTDPKEFGPAILQLLEQIAFSDLGDYVHWGARGVRVKDADQLTPLQRRLVQSVKEDKDGNITITLCSKDQAIKLLGQAAGIFKELHEHSGNVDIGLMDVLKAIDGKTRGLPTPLPSPED